ncbi:MAG TPA: hypothetical protein VFX53_04550 [Pedococcus sp.]|nr:hypothetical protein [Pedococcus sp.]
MTAYVRIRNGEVLRTYVEAHGGQVLFAARCGISAQRMSQLITGTGPVVAVRNAMTIEDELGLRYGFLFRADEADLIRHYLGDSPVDEVVEDPTSTSSTEE